MGDFEDFAKIGCAICLLALLIFVPIGIGAYLLDKQTCYTAWEDFAPEYSLFGGCRVTFNGKRVPTATLRKIDMED